MKKYILLLILTLLLTGCSTSKKCIKSHEEQSTCVRAIYNGKTVQSIVLPCKRTICDEYEETGSD